MEFLIDRAAARHDPRTVSGRERLVAAVLPTLRTISDPVRRDGYLQLLARRANVDERVLLEALRRPEPATGTRNGQRGGGETAGRHIDLEAVMATPGALDPRAVERALEPVESTLLRLLLVNPGLIPDLEGRLAPAALVTTPARELWKALLAAPRPFDRKPFLDGLEATLATIARTLYASTAPLPETELALQQAIDQSLLTLERSGLDDEVEFKRAELAEAEANADRDTARALLEEVRGLQARREDLDERKQGASLLASRRIPAPRIPVAPTPTPTQP